MAPQVHKDSPQVVEQQPEAEEQVLLRAMKKHESDFVYSPPSYFGENSAVPKPLQNVLAHLFIFVTIHYIFWMWPVLFGFYWMTKSGYGVVVVALVVMYVPSFFNRVERTANGRQWEFVRMNKLWELSANYLGLKVIRQQELDGSKKYIFGYHPHGIIILSRVSTYGGTWEQTFPNLAARALGASTMFFVPLARELCLWLGAVDASRSTAEKVLKSGKSVIVYPGGVPEIFMVEPESKENKILLKKRLGFVKLAMRHGAELVPVFVFGEKWLYNLWNPPRAVITFFRKVLQTPMIFFWGKFMWVPKQLPKGKQFGVVYGKPIPVTLNENPTDEEVQALHATYIAAVEKLFEDYKASFGYDDDEKLVVL